MGDLSGHRRARRLKRREAQRDVVCAWVFRGKTVIFEGMARCAPLVRQRNAWKALERAALRQGLAL